MVVIRIAGEDLRTGGWIEPFYLCWIVDNWFRLARARVNLQFFNVIRKNSIIANVQRTKCEDTRSQPERVLCQRAVCCSTARGKWPDGQQTPCAPRRQQIVRSFCLRFIQLPSLFRSNPSLRCGQTGSARYLARMIAPPNRCRRRLSASRIEWHADVPANHDRRAPRSRKRDDHTRAASPAGRRPAHWP
jgi:hypothetical protein